MKLKNKIILVVVIILALSGAVIMGIWYQTSSKLTSTYLQNVSESSMKDAYHAFEYLSRTEGIIPAIESAHAVAYARKLAPTMKKDQIIVINISGRGDKDCAAIARYRGEDIHE